MRYVSVPKDNTTVAKIEDTNTHYANRASNLDAAFASGLAIFGVCSFYAGYAVGTGPVLWVYISESFPDRHRAAALGVLSLVNCLANLLTVYSALYLMNVMAACPLDAQVRPIFSAIFNPVQF